MRRFSAIVESSTEPQDTNVIWFTNKKLHYYTDGGKGWTPIEGGGSNNTIVIGGEPTESISNEEIDSIFSN